MKKILYYLLKVMSKCGLLSSFAAMFGLIAYPCYLVYYYFTAGFFYSPLSLDEYTRFSAITLIGMVCYIFMDYIAEDVIADINESKETK